MNVVAWPAPEIMELSLRSVVRVTFQPLPTSPTTLEAGMRTSDRNTSLKWATPCAWTSGRISIPGERMSTTKKVSPSCLGTSGSVRATRMPKSAYWALEVHTFCPLTTHSSVPPGPVPGSSTARVASADRSDPAPGSENSWHHHSSPDSSLARYRSCCSAVPCCMSVGPTRAWAAVMNPEVASYRASSWLNTIWCAGVPPRPPNRTGQVRPAQPCSATVRCHSMHRRR